MQLQVLLVVVAVSVVTAVAVAVAAVVVVAPASVFAVAADVDSEESVVAGAVIEPCSGVLSPAGTPIDPSGPGLPAGS